MGKENLGIHSYSDRKLFTGLRRGSREIFSFQHFNTYSFGEINTGLKTSNNNIHIFRFPIPVWRWGCPPYLSDGGHRSCHRVDHSCLQ